MFLYRTEGASFLRFGIPTNLQLLLHQITNHFHKFTIIISWSTHSLPWIEEDIFGVSTYFAGRYWYSFKGGSSPEMKKDYHLSFGQNYLNFLTATSERPSPPTVPRTQFCWLAGLVPEMQCKYVATSMQIASFLWSPLRQWHHLLLCHKITAEGGEHNAALSLSTTIAARPYYLFARTPSSQFYVA